VKGAVLVGEDIYPKETDEGGAKKLLSIHLFCEIMGKNIYLHIVSG